jgi:hypothetical protein
MDGLRDVCSFIIALTVDFGQMQKLTFVSCCSAFFFRLVPE